MNKLFALVKRNLKEISRDPVSLCFCLAFPILMLVLMQLIFKNVNAEGANMFMIERFAPAIVTFGFSFTALYVALSVSGDRSSALIMRINMSPIKRYSYLLSYLISVIPVMLIQAIIFYCIAFIFGLPFNGFVFLSLLYLMPSALFYLAAGLLVGALVASEKQAGPVFSILISAAGILGGIWMPLESIGGGFLTFCKCLPFYNGVTLAQNAVIGNIGASWISFIVTLSWTVVIFALAVIIFNKRSKN